MRLTQDERLWRIAFEVAENATCDREKHGCVIARDGLIVATGYNGSVDGEPHCDEVGHEIVLIQRAKRVADGTYWEAEDSSVWEAEDSSVSEVHCTRTLHAEQNAIINAAMIGVSIVNADWYITGVPCKRCAKMIVRTKPQQLFVCSDRGGGSPFGERLAFLQSRGANLTGHNELVLIGKGIIP